MSILTIVLLVLAVVSLGVAGLLKWLETQRQPKEDEVQAQFVVVSGCLVLTFIVLGIVFFFSSILSAIFN